MIVLVCIDDIIVTASNDQLLVKVKNLLKNRFKMKDLDCISWFLGTKFIHEHDCIKMNQTQHLTKLLKKYGISDCKSQQVPRKLKLEFAGNSDMPDENPMRYQEKVGSLIYAMT